MRGERAGGRRMDMPAIGRIPRGELRRERRQPSVGTTRRRERAVAPSLRRRSARQGVRPGRGHEPLGHPVRDMMEPGVKRASIKLDRCS